MMKNIWEEIRSNGMNQDLDMYTIKKNGNRGLWFNLKIDGNCVVVSPSKFNNPSITISAQRNIRYDEFQRVAKQYDSWRAGMVKRSDLGSLSMNSSYIFGMMNYFHMKYLSH